MSLSERTFGNPEFTYLACTAPRYSNSHHLTKLRTFVWRTSIVFTLKIRFDEAALPIPDSVRLLLAKETVETPDPTEGQYAVITAEEMADRAKARLEEIKEQQTGFLPQRQHEVAELKKELSSSDSFHPQQ